MIQKITDSAQNWADILARYPGGKIETTTAVVRRPAKGWADRAAAVFGLPQVLAWGRAGCRDGDRWFVAASSLDEACHCALLDAQDPYDGSDNGNRAIAAWCRKNVRDEDVVVETTTYIYDDGEPDPVEIQREKDALIAARADGWEKINAAAQAADLPRDGQCDGHPACWDVSMAASDNGYLSDGEGGQYYAGMSSPATYSRVDRLVLSAELAAVWDAAGSVTAVAQAVEKINAAITADMTAEQAAKAAREAVLAAERAQGHALAEAERAAYSALSEAAIIPDTEGRRKQTRRASATKLADKADAEKALAAVMAVECPTLATRERANELIGRLTARIAELTASAEHASAMEAIYAKRPAGASPLEIQTILDSGFLARNERDDWSDELADRNATASNPETPETPANLSASMWDALKI